MPEGWSPIIKTRRTSGEAEIIKNREKIDMYQKFIIAGDRKTGRGQLRLGLVTNHRDLVIDYEKVWGGGWWDRDDNARTITLYGSSGDFGPANFAHMNIIDRSLRDYRFIYTPVPGLPGNELDTSHVEWA